MEKVKVLEYAFYYIAGEFAIYKICGGNLSIPDWLRAYSDLEEVITIESERKEFVLSLMKYYIDYINDIKWPHRQ